MQGIIIIAFLIVFMGIVRSMRDRAVRGPSTPPAHRPRTPAYGGGTVGDWTDEDGADARRATGTAARQGIGTPTGTAARQATGTAARDRATTPELRNLARELLSRARQLETYEGGTAQGAMGGGYPLETYAVQPPEGVDMHPSHQAYRVVEDLGGIAEGTAAVQSDEDPYGVFALGEDSLARAMVLREVLGPPVSRRRNR